MNGPNISPPSKVVRFADEHSDLDLNYDPSEAQSKKNNPGAGNVQVAKSSKVAPAHHFSSSGNVISSFDGI